MRWLLAPLLALSLLFGAPAEAAVTNPIDGASTTLTTAATVNLSSTGTVDVLLSGTGSITSLGTCVAGNFKTITAPSGVTFTNGASLITGTGANLVTAAQTVLLAHCEASNVWRLIVSSASGTQPPITGVSGDVVSFNGSGQPSDSGVLLSGLAPINNPALTGTVKIDGATITLAGNFTTGGALTINNMPDVNSLLFVSSAQTVSEIASCASGILLTSAGSVWSCGGAIPNGVTATTQVGTDNSTKIATTAFVAGNFAKNNATLTVFGVTCTLGSSCGASTASNILGADVALNNTATYFDGPSMAQGTSGTWFASGTVTLLDTVLTAFNCKLWDGTTVIASGRVVNAGASDYITMSLSGIITTPAANIRISCEDSGATTGNIKFNGSGNSKDSSIWGVRLN